MTFRARVLMAGCLAGLGACTPRGPARNDVEVRGAWARAADSGFVTAAYFVLVNHTRSPVQYQRATSPVAADVSLHETMAMSGMVHMMPIDSVAPISPGDSLVLAEGAKHLMVSGLRRRIAAGDTLPIALLMSDGRVVPVNAVVRTP